VKVCFAGRFAHDDVRADDERFFRNFRNALILLGVLL
jgi:hypothetical protein